MFERYTEKARRVIFFARYEASQFGSPYIETEHLLLGILREDKVLTNRFLRSYASVESIRKQIEAHTTIRQAVSTSVDLPLSNEGKRVLGYAAEEADQLGHKHIGTEHLLLGVLREKKSFASELLRERGLQLAAVREDLGKDPHPSAVRGPSETNPPTDLFRDLTQAAMEGQLEPLVGRDLELESVIEICGSRHKRNPLLLGEPGAGKCAIVEGLALRIAAGEVPSFLAGKRILAIKPELIAGWTRDRQELTKLMGAQANPSDVILFVDELQDLLGSGALGGAQIIRRALLSEGIQCICTGNASDYREPMHTTFWFRKFFRTIHVRPLDAEGTLRVLLARKSRLENFHGVTYTDEALGFAAHSSGSYLPESALPGKAIELLDTAGSLVKSRQRSTAVVGLDDIKEVIARWAAYPYCP